MIFKWKHINIYILLYYYIIFIKCKIYHNENKIIISLTSDHKNIQNSFKIIDSVLNQNIEKDLYEILLILSKKEYNNIQELPDNIQLLEKSKKIKIEFISGIINNQSKYLYAIKKYTNNPILLINNECILPNGWLEMYIKDHLQYPNDAIVGNVQYFFGKNGEVMEFSEGFKGERFGIFNHITETIFNFALINIDLGGILYPKNYFKNSSFYDEELFLKCTNNSEEFWQSAFIILEDKTLRQSSIIFDYTKYLIKGPNYEENHFDKAIFFKNIKKTFMKNFTSFNYFIKRRQNKIIVSFTTYPERFFYIPGLMKILRNQNCPIKKIILFLYKEDYELYHLNISDLKIILTDKDLKPHKKYFYAMKLFREYAIITLDDDMNYDKYVLESLLNSYVENPNIISGRRTHLMSYKKNKELNKYSFWRYEQKLIKKPDFNLFLTGCGGIIYPPDILNINDEILPIINETITNDDFTLKYLEIKKGIPIKWIANKKVTGVQRLFSKNSLFSVNKILNNIYINKLNIMIDKTFLTAICTPYRNLNTGITIFLFDIHNKRIINNKLFFDLIAFSHCPLDSKIKFDINFDNLIAKCFINEKNILFNNNNKKNIKTASCKIKKFVQDLDIYLFPKAISKDIPKIIINQYLCSDKTENDPNTTFPIIKSFKCKYLYFTFKITKTFVSGIPKNIDDKIISKNTIPNKFLISRIVEDSINNNKQIILIGKLENDFKKDSYLFHINFLYPQITLLCSLKPFSKYVQSKLYCNHNIKITTEILLENQIVYSINNEKELILVNEETLIKIGLYKIYDEEFDKMFIIKIRYYCFILAICTLVILIKYYSF